MARRNSTGGVIGLILAALCFAAVLVLFQAHAAAGDSALYMAQSVSVAR